MNHQKAYCVVEGVVRRQCAQTAAAPEIAMMRSGRIHWGIAEPIEIDVDKDFNRGQVIEEAQLDCKGGA